MSLESWWGGMQRALLPGMRWLADDSEEATRDDGGDDRLETRARARRAELSSERFLLSWTQHGSDEQYKHDQSFSRILVQPSRAIS